MGEKLDCSQSFMKHHQIIVSSKGMKIFSQVMCPCVSTTWRLFNYADTMSLGVMNASQCQESFLKYVYYMTVFNKTKLLSKVEYSCYTTKPPQIYCTRRTGYRAVLQMR